MFGGKIRLKSLLRFGTRFNSNFIDVGQEVQSALHENKAVVALESTIITHGMPYPQNYETAVSVENIIRELECVPAHIAVYKGRIKVGLSNEQLQRLSDPKIKPVKISRRDFPFVINNKMYGGTTVCGTLMVADSVGIPIFVTGGIGGVHRNGENTLDISADLRELGRHPIMVVSSGVKSILNIELTLEYLETEGVCVATYGPDKHFPAFYSVKSGLMAPYHVTTPTEAANLLHNIHQLKMNSGLLLAVPVPKEFSIDYEIMDKNISLALQKSHQNGITGKEVTPYVLHKISQFTEGTSLKSNMALIRNNALIGAQIAKEFETINRKGQKFSSSLHFDERKQPVVIGGSVFDCVITLEADLKMDGRTLTGKIAQSPGGVGRNLADALGKLYSLPPLFVSAVGDDQFGTYLLDSLEHIDCSGVSVNPSESTACYSVLVDKFGEAKVGVGDMDIHSKISPDEVTSFRHQILNSPLIVMDGNIPQETIDHVLKLAGENKIPLWYEPTDLVKAVKPFTTDLWKKITYTSPNLNELISMAKSIGVKNIGLNTNDLQSDDLNKFLERLKNLAVPLAKHIPVIMVTLGKRGILMVSRTKPDEPFFKNAMKDNNKEIYVRYYPGKPLTNIVNAIGAGDCTAAGFLSGVFQGFTEPECIELGILAGQQALNSKMAIPKKFEIVVYTQHDLYSQFINIPVD